MVHTAGLSVPGSSGGSKEGAHELEEFTVLVQHRLGIRRALENDAPAHEEQLVELPYERDRVCDEYACLVREQTARTDDIVCAASEQHAHQTQKVRHSPKTWRATCESTATEECQDMLRDAA